MNKTGDLSGQLTTTCDRSSERHLLSSKVTSSGRLHYLDAVRGLAAISVIGSHYVIAYSIPWAKWAWTNTPLHIVWDGFAAVSLFFVLSGLVLSLRHFRNTDRPVLLDFNYSAYAASRVCRIWLPYVVIMATSIVCQRLVTLHPQTPLPVSDWMVNHWINKLSFGECIREALMGGVTLTMVPQGWTLKQELVLSLVIPVGILLATRHALWLAGTTLFAIACLKLSPFAFHFTLGILIAKHYTQIEEYMTKHRLLRSLVLLVGLLLYTYRYTVPSYLGMSDDALYIWFITGVGSACILVFAIASPHTRSFFSQKWAIYIGRISYSVYLTHMLVLICLTPYVLKLLAWLPPGILWLGGLGFSVGCVVVISEVSYRLVEAPSIALGKKLGAVAQRLRLP